MYEGINAYGGANDALALAIGIYFALLVIIGNCILVKRNPQRFLWKNRKTFYYKSPESCFLNKEQDTLLNIFLAIAVDNLTTANQLTKDEENEKQKKKEGKDREENERKTSRSVNGNEMTSSKKKSSPTIRPLSERSKDEEEKHRKG